MLPSHPFPNWPAHLEVSDATVDVSQLVPALQGFLRDAAEMHYVVFGLPLVITSGNDGQHAPGSKHYQWKAVDLRSHDLEPQGQDAFAFDMIPLQRQHSVGVFDERFIGQPHWHVESA